MPSPSPTPALSNVRPDSKAAPRTAFAEESSVIARPRIERGDSVRDHTALWCGAVSTIPILGVGLWVYWAPRSPWMLLIGVVLALAVAWILAFWVAERLTRGLRRGLEQLSDQCCAIDSEWRYGDSTPRPDPSAPAEIRRLVRDFDRMARRVDLAFARLRTALDESGGLQDQLEKEIENREDEIRSRTVELQVANLNLERLARQDGLTGIANHRRFVEFADQIWRLCMREGQSVAVVMIDVDHFKAFNDIYGHQAGDQCLKKVSTAIASIARRPLDLAARYGGEEFAVVLSHTGLEDALGLAEQARRAVLDLEIPHAGSPSYGKVSISLGVAALKPERDTEATVLISMADKALYRAKRGGRNRSEH